MYSRNTCISANEGTGDVSTAGQRSEVLLDYLTLLRYNGKELMIQQKIHELLGEVNDMSRIKTIATRDLNKSVQNGGCGECQTSCQSACKTSCGVANQPCEKQ